MSRTSFDDCRVALERPGGQALLVGLADDLGHRLVLGGLPHGQPVVVLEIGFGAGERAEQIDVRVIVEQPVGRVAGIQPGQRGVSGILNRRAVAGVVVEFEGPSPTV
jgi:hypothetical protein